MSKMGLHYSYVSVFSGLWTRPLHQEELLQPKIAKIAIVPYQGFRILKGK